MEKEGRAGTHLAGCRGNQGLATTVAGRGGGPRVTPRTESS